MTWHEQKYDEFSKNMVEKYPAMFSQPYGGFCIGAGWWPIIESLCSQIQGHIEWKNNTRKHLLKDNPYGQEIPDEVPQVIVNQIKEKFGGLRFYYQGGDDAINGMVRMAESWASKSCEECGKPGAPRHGGWMKTLCDEHEAERQARMKEFDAD